ncbi:MAG: tetratricopeptide repeat protein, partial [Chloroflexi bacterium]|nr:tetratricopeptide repeat protein [Chloroflexota bacterium]
MIRQVLPFDSHPSIVALDAALRRGDLLFVRQLLFEQTKDTDKENRERIVAAWLLRKAAYAYLASENQDVQTYVEKLLPMRPRPTADVIAAARFLQALAYTDLKQPEEVERALGQVEASAVEGSSLLGYVWLARATLALYMNRYEEVETYIQYFLSQPTDDAWALWQSLRLRGLVAHQETNHVEAQSLLNDAREGFAALEDRYEVARCDKALANTYRRLDDEYRAIVHAQAAVEYFRSQELTIPLARCLNTLGAILLYFNQVETALEHFREAASHLEESGLHPELAHTVANMGLCYFQLGRPRLALRAYERARELVVELHLPYPEATVAMYQASLHWLNGESDTAIQHILEALRLFEQVKAKMQIALCWRKLGEYLMEMPRWEEAEAYLEQSSKIFLQHQSPVQAALASVSLGRLHLLRGNCEQARTLLETSAMILRQHGQIYEAAVADIWLGEIHAIREAYEKANLLFSQALDNASVGYLRNGWRAWQGLAHIAKVRKNWEQALAYYQNAIVHMDRLRRSALSPQGAAHLAKESITLYDEVLQLALQLNRTDIALGVLEEQKAAQLIERLRPRPDETVPEVMPGFSQPHSIAGYATRLQGLRASMHDAWSKEEWTRLSRLEQEFQQITQKMDALNAPYAGLFETKPLDI